MELKINFKNKNFIFEKEENLEDKLYIFLKDICDIFLDYKDYFDLNTFELSLSTERKIRRKSPVKNYYIAKYEKKERDILFYYPIGSLKYIMRHIHNLLSEDKYEFSNVLGHYKEESFFIKVRLKKNIQIIAHENNVKANDLTINKNNFKHLIDYADRLGLNDLVVGIINNYLIKEKISFEKAMSFFQRKTKL